MLPLPAADDGTGSDAAAAAAREAIERNHWYCGGVFKTYWAHHFHAVTHECYAVVSGASVLLLGVGPLDGEGDGDGEAGGKDGSRSRRGVEVQLGRGDVVVLPVSLIGT